MIHVLTGDAAHRRPKRRRSHLQANISAISRSHPGRSQSEEDPESAETDLRRAVESRRGNHQDREAKESDYRTLLRSSARSDDERIGCRHAEVLERTSDAEIAQLVSVALEGALRAFAQDDPKAFLQLQACNGRLAMRKALASLPDVQNSDPVVRREYRNAILFQNVVLELALDIMDAITRFSRAKIDD